MKLGQNACLGNCSVEFDGSGEQSRAIMALLFGDMLQSGETFSMKNNKVQ
jgi:hypothetical protein